MPHSDFVHLRVHDAYSLSEGAIKIPDLVAMCVERDVPAVGVADTGNMFGALEFSLAARGAGLQPIIGCQIALKRDGTGLPGGGAPGADWLVLLVQSDEGYRNLLSLVSRSYLDSAAEDSAQIEYDDLAAHAGGLIALTGGVEGPVGRLLREGQHAEAESMLDRLAAMFEDRLYIELMRHGLPAEDEVEPAFIEFAYAKNLPLVATNEVFFADRGMYEAHDALLCIAAGATVSRADRRRVTPEHYLKSAREMRELFADLPEAIDNTMVVARRCAFMPDTLDPILPVYTKLDGHSEIEVLRRMSEDGLETRLEKQVFGLEDSQTEREAAATPYRERLDYELGVIAQMGFPGYFSDRGRFHPMGQESGHSGWTGARIGRRFGRRLGADDHRSGPAEMGLAVRAVPQSRTGIDAGFRYRFLQEPPGRCDPLCAAGIRRGPGGPDHHLR